MTNRGKRMGFLTDKLLLALFMVVLRTKRIAKSAIDGKINHQIRKITPFALGAIIVGWTLFVYLF
jgi:hypothetical protein